MRLTFRLIVSLVLSVAAFSAYVQVRQEKERLRGLGGLKIVFLSSLAGVQDEKWGLDAAADAYLAKPVGVETLLDTVRHVLDDA